MNDQSNPTTTNAQPTVSIIIPSYNSARSIARTLKSVYTQSAYESITDIVVVDSSDDDNKSRDVMTAIRDQHREKANSDKTQFVFLDEKTIPSIGRNTGVEHAKGNLLCFIDSDICLDKDWLKEVLTAYQEGKHVGGGSVALPHDQRWSLIAEAQQYLQFNEFLDTGVTKKKDFLPSCNMYCTRDIFEAVGGFPDMRASEDVMFFLSMKDRFDVWFIPKAKSFHVFRLTWDGFRNNQKVLGKYVAIYRRSLYHESTMYQGIYPFLLTPLFILVKWLRMSARIVTTSWDDALHYTYSLPSFIYGLFFWTWGLIEGFQSDEEMDISALDSTSTLATHTDRSDPNEGQ